jgi:hypothetical protein
MGRRGHTTKKESQTAIQGKNLMSGRLLSSMTAMLISKEAGFTEN